MVAVRDDVARPTARTSARSCASGARVRARRARGPRRAAGPSSWSQIAISSCSLLADVVVQAAGGAARSPRSSSCIEVCVVAALRRRRAPPSCDDLAAGGGRSARAARVGSAAWPRAHRSHSVELRTIIRTSNDHSVSSARMHFDLDDDTELLQRTVRDFARERGRAGRRGARPHQGVPLRDRRARWASSGWMGIPFPEEVGGAGGTHAAVRDRRRGARRASTRSVAITMCAHTSLGTQPIYLFGSDEQKERLPARPVRGPQARRLRADRARGGLATPATSRTRARARRRRVGDRRREAVHHQRGHRHLRPRGDHRADRASGEISNLIVENGTPGYEQGEPYRKMGWNASDTRPADLRRTAACPRRTCSARAAQGFKQFLHILDIGRIGVAAMGVGLAQGALDEALAYAKERQAFGQPISQVPGDPGQARRHGDRDRGRAAARPTRRRG